MFRISSNIFVHHSAGSYNAAKDRFRARITGICLGLTFLGAAISVYMGKEDKKKGHDMLNDQIKSRMEYSKTHQDLAKSMYKESKE
jgi:hypothetical protein